MGFAHEVTLSNEEPLLFEETPSLKKAPLHCEEASTGGSKKKVVFVVLVLSLVFLTIMAAGAVALTIGLSLSLASSSNSSSSSTEVELGLGDCLTNDDCPPHDHCIPPSDCSNWGFEYGRCESEECNSSADCGSGEVCMRLNVNKCIPAPCISDFDCPHGRCVLYVAPSCSPAQSQMYCETSADQCHHDDDCEGLYRRCVAGECTRVF